MQLKKQEADRNDIQEEVVLNGTKLVDYGGSNKNNKTLQKWEKPRKNKITARVNKIWNRKTLKTNFWDCL